MSPTRDEARQEAGSSTGSSTSPRVTSPYPSAHVRQSRASTSGNSSGSRAVRQQFSACGACRMRRVKCDLKDLPIPTSGLRPSCSHCTERGLKCVDEFAEVKAAKLLRRGRRLQQVEAVYGKASDDDDMVPMQSIIPKLRPEFFDSVFFQRLHIQRPIIDYTEFATRYITHTEGKAPMGPAGLLIASLLVVWGVSFGVNEAGVEIADDPAPSPPSLRSPEAIRRRRERKAATNAMLREVLHLIDIHGILRRPSWDGVRALLLTLPLTSEEQTPMDRLAMYEATLSQIYTLCSLAPVSSVSSGQGDQVDTLVRARIFWYAHVHEGVTSGLRGGRVTLSEDDLAQFQATLPPPTAGFPDSYRSLAADGRPILTYPMAARFATVPLRISGACRQIHQALTGPKARQKNRMIDEVAMEDVWDSLEGCWRGLEAIRESGPTGVISEEDIERFVHGWQIFIFECHNIVREGLKQRLALLSDSPRSDPPMLETEDQKPPSTVAMQHDQAMRLHAISAAKCQHVVKRVVAIIRKHFSAYESDPPFFAYDASLMRDGCFFAAFLLASDQSDTTAERGAELDDDVEICLRALRSMRWGFSKSEEREQTVHMVWEATRKKKAESLASGLPMDSLGPPMSSHPGQRPILAPLSMSPTAVDPRFGPRSSLTEDGSGGWSMPPPMSDPVSTIATPVSSHRGSPHLGFGSGSSGGSLSQSHMHHLSLSSTPPGGASMTPCQPMGLVEDLTSMPSQVYYGQYPGNHGYVMAPEPSPHSMRDLRPSPPGPGEVYLTRQPDAAGPPADAMYHPGWATYANMPSHRSNPTPRAGPNDRNAGDFLPMKF